MQSLSKLHIRLKDIKSNFERYPGKINIVPNNHIYIFISSIPKAGAIKTVINSKAKTVSKWKTRIKEV